MDNYIDIHSHILPGLDDGSKSMEETKRMLETASREGIRTIIATPHYCEGRRVPSLTIMEETIQKVRDCIVKDYPKMDIYLGCEIYYSHEIIHLLKEKQLLTMAGSKYILVEFSPVSEFKYMKSGLRELLQEGYWPVLAHVERYRNILNHIDFVQELIDMGVYIQVNAESVTGGLGRTIKRFVKKLLKYNLLHFIGTDAHGDKIRTPQISQCIRYITKKYSDSYVKELFVDNPSKIFKNEYL